MLNRKILVFLLFFMPFFAYGQKNVDYESDVQALLKKSAEFEKKKDYKEATRFLNEAAIKAWEQKDHGKAILYFDKSVELNELIDNQSGIAKIQSNLAMIYSDIEEYEKSLGYFNEALEYRLAYGAKPEIISTHINKSVVLNNLTRHQEAAKHLEAALALATEMSDAAQMKSCYGMLSETYEKAGNEEQAIHYFNLYRTFHEMIQREKVEEANKEVEETKIGALRLELEKQQKELALLRAEKQLREKEEEVSMLNKEVKGLMEKMSKQDLAVSLLEKERELDKARILDGEREVVYQKSLSKIISIGLGFVFVFSILLFIGYRKNKKLNHSLDKQNAQITALNEDLETQVAARTEELQTTVIKLKKRNLELSQFSHVISHNLRGPIATVLGLSQTINQENLADPLNAKVFDGLVSTVGRMDMVVKEITVLLNIAENEELPLEYIDLKKITSCVTASLKDELELSKATLKVDFDELPTVKSVKAYLENILFNLISNAAKYKQLNENAEIQVVSSSNSETCCLKVIDNGIGIDQGDYDQIFEPYKRKTRFGGGRGLGLYLVKLQVEAMSGRIEVESVKGQGSEFRVVLPLN
ncbi:ATP-binding protein [Flammeovirgaceae bacterium SG7u.111]|nr:ATP-binding protein [Flammeovirgaceae bacterium SG7u.132]WPO34939.1 ATP-binding protein [Flammeovirgaceae bacterium SG7u.111]